MARTTAAKAEPEGPAAPDLERVKRMFLDSVNLTQDARNESLVDRDYYDGYQFTAQERAVLQSRKQPDIVLNHVRLAVNGTLGVVQQGQTDPRAYPRNPKDQESADVASQVLRYAADRSDFDDIKIECFENMLVEGTGAAIVEVNADLDVMIRQIRWEEFFADPRSRKKDWSDARYMGIAKWMYADDVKAMYRDHSDDIEACIGGAGNMPADQSYEDRPIDSTAPWADRRLRRLRVVEMYHLDTSGWQRCVFHASGLLAYGPSPYLDHKKRPDNPIVARSIYVDKENRRQGIVRDMRCPQDEINKRRAKLLHLVTVSQIEMADASAINVDADTARKEAARPDGVIPRGWRRVPTTDMAAGQASLLQEAKGEIARMGPNPAVLGREGVGTSGRAQLIRQNAGLTEQATLFGGLENFELRCYRQIWNRVRQYWTAPMWVRVTDDVGAPQFVGINQPKGEPVIDPQTGQPMMGEDGQPQEGPPPVDEMGQPLLGYRNQVAEMDVDIILDSTPDTANVAHEQFLGMVELAKAGLPIPPKVLIEASTLPNKAKLIESMEDEQAQQIAMLKMQLELKGMAAKVAETEASAKLKGAQAVNEEAHGVIDAHAAGVNQGLAAA